MFPGRNGINKGMEVGKPGTFQIVDMFLLGSVVAYTNKSVSNLKKLIV